MRRLAATLVHDVRLQWRQGFFLAGAFTAGFFLVLLMLVPVGEHARVVPPFALTNLITTTFYFVAGLVFFERGEGSLLALRATPLRREEYLLSKTATLTLLATLETLAIVAFARVGGIAWAPLLLGMVLASVLYTLIGFLVATRYESVTDFLIPSAGWLFVLSTPLLDYFGLWESAWFRLWPTQALLELLEASLAPAPAATLAYALLYPVVWIAGLGIAARSALGSFARRAPGAV